MNIRSIITSIATGVACTLCAADPAPTSVVQIDHVKLAPLWTKGGKIMENEEFKVAASRRDKAGKVEIHAHDTDIFLIIDGSAEFVTGGTVVELKTGADGESSGREITGGETHHLAKGDVIVIPRGVPHWFKEVHGQILYYVVKVVK